MEATYLRSLKGFTFRFFKQDLSAGIVVFLVALPLSMGIALASGAPLFSGIIAGIVGGLIVASVSGSQLSVSGPAAGLTVIVFNAIQQLGYQNFLLAVVLGGALQIILGFLEAGVIAYYFPSSVIKGMLAAIGIILILKQLPHTVGFYNGQVEMGAILISLVSFLILFLWERPFLKKYNFFKLVPGALLVVMVGAALNTFFKFYFPQFYLGEGRMVQLPVATSPTEFFQQFTLPNFSAFQNIQVYGVAFSIAIIASLESLLSIEAADKLDPYKRTTHTDRELKAQGLGNMVSGLIGGLPLTAVIVRSSANINAGAKTKLAAVIHGVFLLLSVAIIASFLNKIPLACLAVILVLVGYKLAKVSLFRDMYRLGWSQFLPFVVTVVAIQFTDLLKGIAVGMTVAIFFILRNNYKRPFHRVDHPSGEVIVIKLAEDVTFINKGSVALTLDELPNGSTVIIDGSQSHDIDLDVIEIIHNFKETARIKNIKLELKNIPEFRGVSGH